MDNSQDTKAPSRLEKVGSMTLVDAAMSPVGLIAIGVGVGVGGTLLTQHGVRSGWAGEKAQARAAIRHAGHQAKAMEGVRKSKKVGLLEETAQKCATAYGVSGSDQEMMTSWFSRPAVAAPAAAALPAAAAAPAAAAPAAAAPAAAAPAAAAPAVAQA